MDSALSYVFPFAESSFQKIEGFVKHDADQGKGDDAYEHGSIVCPSPGIDDIEAQSPVRTDRFDEKEHCYGSSGYDAERREYAGQAHGPDHVVIEIEATAAQ